MRVNATARNESNGIEKGELSNNGSPFPKADAATHCEMCANRVGLAGRSVIHRQLLWELQRAAQFDTEVFLVGETGVGKELYARFVHECSPRSGGAFIAVNCGAIPEALFENEMFGHSAGAYTDAKVRSDGLIAAASGGTLFLDEVNELPKSGQVKLLRLLQEKEYRRLGEAKLRRADIRVISAMNRDPAKAIEDGVLRQDLFYRLNVNTKKILPLRERPEDIELFTDRFVARYANEYGRTNELVFTVAARRLLAAYHWPGNIRQLENVIRSLVCEQVSSTVDAHELPITQPHESVRAYSSAHLNTLLGLPFADAKHQIVERFEVDYVREMLRRTGGNICQAAKLAGKNRRAFFELMRKHNIFPGEFKQCTLETMDSNTLPNRKPR